MKILFLSFYYQPDYSAGSFRNTALVKALQMKLSKDDVIDIYTTMPNRYGKLNSSPLKSEKYNSVSVTRISTFSGLRFFSQVVAYFQYAFYVVSYAKKQEYDLIYASSGRLMTAALAAYLSRSKNTKLYLDIRDIFYDSFRSSFPNLKFLLPIISKIEKYTMRSASHINLVSFGFQDYFLKKYPNKKYSFYSNGIDDEFLNKDYDFDAEVSDQKKILLYIGNIGVAQGLACIIPDLAQKIKDTWKIKIIGSGNSLHDLKVALRKLKIDNVEISPPIERSGLVEIYKQSSCLFLHLNDVSAFKKPLPSKVFEYASTGKPILAGVQGYAKKFISENIEGAGIFSPCDAIFAEQQLHNLNLKLHDRSKFIEKYRRDIIMNHMSQSVIKMCNLVNEKTV